MNIRRLGVGERRGVRMKIDSGEGKKERQTPGLWAAPLPPGRLVG